MIWIIVAAVVAIYLTIKVARAGGYDPIVYGLILILFMFSAIMPNVLLAGSFSEYVNCSTHSLSSLQDRAGSSGSFFLGSGSQNDQPVFYFYQKDHDTYRLMRVPADEAIIKVDSNPRRVVCSSSSSNRWMALFGAGPNHNTFLVPEGSVVSSFNLDAK